MRRLRCFCEELKPGFALIGEVLFGDYNLIVNDEMLHSCTNYECYKGIHSSFNSMNLFEIAHSLNRQYGPEQWCIYRGKHLMNFVDNHDVCYKGIHSSFNSMNLFEIAHSLNRQYGPEQWCIYRGKHLMNFVDNHDVTRIASILTNPEHLPLAYGILFGMPGIPCIYYGSEWGEEGKKAPDNDYALRPCFEEPKPNELTKFITELIDIRKDSDALCNGGYHNVVITNHQLIFERKSKSERVLVTINADSCNFTANNGELSGTYEDLITGKKVDLSNQLSLPGYSVQYLKQL